MLAFNIKRRFSSSLPLSGKIQNIESKSPFRPDKRYNVLSLDGGGARGLMTTEMLAALEQKLADKTGNQDFKIS